MKKIFCLIISFIACIGLVDAATIKVNDGEAEAGKKGNTVTLGIEGSDLNLYNKIEFELTLSGTENADLDLQRYEPSKNGAYSNFSKDNGKFVYQSSNGFTENVLGTIYYDTYDDFASNFTINVVNAKFCKSDDDCIDSTTGANTKSGTIKYVAPLSTDATLTSLSVSQGTLTPAFASDVFEYTVNVMDTIQTINLTATPAPKAIREGTGNKTLTMGENVFEIKVTAEDKKTTNTYKVVVNRGVVSKPSAYIKELKINNVGCTLSPEFDSKNNKYTITASKDITKINFVYTLEDANATLVEDGNEELKLGENKVTLTVTSSDEEEEQVYEFTVNVTEEEATTTAVVTDDGESESKPKTWLLIIIIFVVILIVGVLAFFLFRKKKIKKSVKKEAEVEPEEQVEAQPNNVLYTDEKTTTYDLNTFREAVNNEEDLDKTKEFNINDFKD